MQGHSLHSGLKQEMDFDENWLTWQEDFEARPVKRCENKTKHVAISDNHGLSRPYA
jgi:hypothetical protein